MIIRNDVLDVSPFRQCFFEPLRLFAFDRIRMVRIQKQNAQIRSEIQNSIAWLTRKRHQIEIIRRDLPPRFICLRVCGDADSARMVVRGIVMSFDLMISDAGDDRDHAVFGRDGCRLHHRHEFEPFVEIRFESVGIGQIPTPYDEIRAERSRHPIRLFHQGTRSANIPTHNESDGFGCVLRHGSKRPHLQIGVQLELIKGARLQSGEFHAIDEEF